MEEETSDLNKPTWKPKFMSEFSMGQYDFKRYDTWLERAERSSAMINSTEIPSLEMIQQYFSELNVLYKSWRPLIAYANVTKEIDSAIFEAKKKKRKWEESKISGFPINRIQVLEIVDLLDKIHTRLLFIKQIVGLGIAVKKNMSTAEKIKRGIRGDKDLASLPEQ